MKRWKVEGGRGEGGNCCLMSKKYFPLVPSTLTYKAGEILLIIWSTYKSFSYITRAKTMPLCISITVLLIKS